MSESLQVLMAVKDLNYFQMYKETLGNNIKYDEFITIGLLGYLQGILIPIILSVYTFFTYKKININWLYKAVWVLLLLSSLIMKIMEFFIGSIFFYISIIATLILLMYILSIKLR
ncbi:hypothetical protein [Miniphocaeibacter halophilus]|uniref:Uncharacterized protein n=1 Tax=Miniphocaeibacter halophilus TaxID=2931922 RepID=A0AC61MNY9_9FIRM|nr:hypothetical protein [Miniphocaeibacter halophilus]QQK07176.1 hypothetical protein JFY71_07540 [Miniphocaeibacter halophilus]